MFVVVVIAIIFNTQIDISDACAPPSSPVSPRVPLDRDLYTSHQEARTKILAVFNDERRTHFASNMLRMEWNIHAARASEIIATRCEELFQHNNYSAKLPRFGPAKHTALTSVDKLTWENVIRKWFSGSTSWSKGMTYNTAPEDAKLYTQLVWSTTHQVGCSVARCNVTFDPEFQKFQNFYNYFCYFAPVGNYEHQYSYKIGPACGDCPNNCDYGLCTNGCLFGNMWKCACEEMYNSIGDYFCKEAEINASRRTKDIATNIKENCKATCNCHSTDKIYERYRKYDVYR